MRCERVSASRSRGTMPICAVLISLSLTGCSKRNSDNDAAQTGQVIAHVGAADITTQELDNEFRLANIASEKRTPEIIKAILNEIVLRKYAEQQALAAKLDREPSVHLDLLRSREQVLAAALVQRTMASKASIGKSEVDRYIGAHPTQFDRREIISLDQITFAVSAETASVVEATKPFKTLDQVDQKLTEMNIPHSRSNGVLDSANISGEFFKALQAKKDDDIFFIRNGPNGTFFKVTGEQPKPLIGEDASNRARTLIRTEMYQASLDQMKAAAQASAKYEGEYAKIMDAKASEKASPPEKP